MTQQKYSQNPSPSYTLSQAIFNLNEAKKRYRREVLDLIEFLKQEVDECYQGGRPGLGISTRPFNEAREEYLYALDIVDDAMNKEQRLSSEGIQSLKGQLCID